MNEYVREPVYTTADTMPRLTVGAPVDPNAMRSVGPAYAPHNMNAPMLEGKEIVGLVLATVMALGPLSAYAFGFGL